MVNDVLPKGWYWTTLGEIAVPNSKSIVSGPFGSNIGSRFFVKQGVPVIRGNNLTTDVRRFIDDGFVFVNESKADELGNCDAVADDLIFTAAGSLGQVGIIPQDAIYKRYIISNKQLRARLDRHKALPLFAFYWLSSAEMVRYIQQRNTGSTVPLINLSVLRSLPMPIPPISEQRAIIHFLSTLDSKIELNQRMSETLEEMARALFESWFVDFDPVRAKADGYRLELPESVIDLFPDSFEDSELGEIPARWSVATIDDVADINALSLSRIDPLPVIDYVEISEVMKGDVANIVRYERGSEPSRARRRLTHGDTVLSTVRPDRGAYFLALNPPETLIASTGFAVLTPKNGSWAFLYSLATRQEVGEYLGRMADGGAYPAIRADVIGTIPVALPPSPEPILRFEQVVRPLLEKCAQNRLQSQTLGKLRDALLPKLISGELRVPDAERIVGGEL
jgi:type I restriction enzyme S subunit